MQIPVANHFTRTGGRHRACGGGRVTDVVDGVRALQRMCFFGPIWWFPSLWVKPTSMWSWLRGQRYVAAAGWRTAGASGSPSTRRISRQRIGFPVGDPPRCDAVPAQRRSRKTVLDCGADSVDLGAFRPGRGTCPAKDEWARITRLSVADGQGSIHLRRILPTWPDKSTLNGATVLGAALGVGRIFVGAIVGAINALGCLLLARFWAYCRFHATHGRMRWSDCI